MLTYKQLSIRKDEMTRLRFDEKWSYQMIANKYQITRERVRQILKDCGPSFRYSKCSRLQDKRWLQGVSHLTNQEIAALLGCSVANVQRYRGKTRHAVENTDWPGRVGIGSEDKVSILLTKNGIENELMPFRHPYDILVYGNIRIDVKSAAKPWLPPSINYISTAYRFRLRGSRKRIDADIYILFIVPTNDVFIIPVADIKETQRYIVFAWPTNRPCSKWSKYHNRFDLIEAYRQS